MPDQSHPAAKIPRATYRFQFNEHFRLNDARALVPYLHQLGVSHIYASPLFKAMPHSSHGYDGCDFTRLNPEIGTEADLAKLVSALRAHDMGLVLDIVPNHMGIGGQQNKWWWDVLKHGRSSKFAGYFDIDWDSDDVGLRGKVLAPVLGDAYANILERGELQLRREKGEIVLGYFENSFPIAPASIPKTLSIRKINEDRTALDGLIQRQNYHLAFWKEGDARLNYRRFFAISTLAALRVEDKKVFDHAHALVHRWYKKGWIDGLRVDHPDGLRDPEQYLKRLRALAPKAWIVVEKILEPGESLPTSWPVAGTTGYDFLNQVGGIFIDPAGEKALSDDCGAFTGETCDYAKLVHDNKRLVLKTLLAAEVRRLSKLLHKIAARRNGYGHFTPQQLADGIIELVVFFPVYRSYIAPDRKAIAGSDIKNIKHAAKLACESRPNLPSKLFALIHDLLAKRQHSGPGPEFVYRFQQLTGPAMAKGAEDTAFFCFNRLQALNEVGGDPGRFGVSREHFHQFCEDSNRHWPNTMLATSTHDTKLSEDVRARLSVLSEIPEVWRRTARKWSLMNARHRQGNWPDRNAEYLFYQALLGAWPLSLERALAFMEKAIRESKQHTTWAEPNADYEKAVRQFVSATMRDRKFMAAIETFVSSIAISGCINSLAQTLIKLTAPGVPDIYQGCEIFDFSLVDPDNRRSVDFHRRRELLGKTKQISGEAAWTQKCKDLAKLWLIRKTLNLRARQPQFFNGAYQPLNASGGKANYVVAFLRGDSAITVTPRFLLKLNNNWDNTSLTLPPGDWRCEFSGETHSGSVRLEKLSEKFPVALLVRKEGK